MSDSADMDSASTSACIDQNSQGIVLICKTRNIYSKALGTNGGKSHLLDLRAQEKEMIRNQRDSQKRKANQNVFKSGPVMGHVGCLGSLLRAGN